MQQIEAAGLPTLPPLKVHLFSLYTKGLQNVDEHPFQTRNNFANVWLSKT